MNRAEKILNESAQFTISNLDSFIGKHFTLKNGRKGRLEKTDKGYLMKTSSGPYKGASFKFADTGDMSSIIKPATAEQAVEALNNSTVSVK